LRDLIEWTSKDAVRFFLLSRKADTEYVFDVDLARAKNNENPVYYVQYAHARICSVLRTACDKNEDMVKQEAHTRGQDETSVLTAWAVNHPDQISLQHLDSAPAQALMMLLAKYPQMLTQACADLAPHDVTFYLRDLAACYHSYYDAERILVEDKDLMQSRVALVAATAQVLRNGLALLGVAAPQSM
jgi:arginyl-tRNA synthetase